MLSKLIDASIFRHNQTGGLLNRIDFWDVISENVEIYHDDILKLDNRLVWLKNGDEVTCDVVLYGTGFLDFFEKDLLVKLDLPHKFDDDPIEDVAKWSRLEKNADKKVVWDFPMLANPPEHYHKPIETTPYRLYNGIPPLHDDSIVFLDFVTVGNLFKSVECQAV